MRFGIPVSQQFGVRLGEVRSGERDWSPLLKFRSKDIETVDAKNVHYVMRRGVGKP